MTLKGVHVIIEGRVQGVGYRMFVQDVANRYHVSGWVRNKEDGRVEAVIEGENDVVNDVVEALYARSAYLIRVDSIQVSHRNVTGLQGFEIRR